jgi:hypothetical protein
MLAAKQQPKKLLRASRACTCPNPVTCATSQPRLTLYRDTLLRPASIALGPLLTGQLEGDFCHRRSIKCHPSATDSRSCQNCYDFDLPCTYNRPLKRGRATGYTLSGGPGSSAADQNQHQQLRPGWLQPVAQVAPAAPVTGADARSASLSSASARPSSGFAASRVHTAGREKPGEEWPDASWRAFAAASAGTIEYLVDVYLQVVYPM